MQETSSLRSLESKDSELHLDGDSCFGVFKDKSVGQSNSSSARDMVRVSSDSEGPGKFKIVLGEAGDTVGISVGV